MSFNDLSAKPGQPVWDPNLSQYVGRINVDGTEDQRFTARGDMSILNGIIRLTNWTPSNPQRLIEKFESKSNGYILKGYTVLLQICDLPVEMWAIKAAELLGDEFSDITELLERLSLFPEKERRAKIESVRRLFGKQLKKVSEIAPSAKAQVDDFFDNYTENIDKAFSHSIFTECPHDSFYSRLRAAEGHYWFLGLHECIEVYHDLRFDWYLVWRKLFGIRSRLTPQLRKYFYSRLLSVLEDTSIPRRYRDFEYARKLSRRLIYHLTFKAICKLSRDDARKVIKKHQYWTREMVNADPSKLKEVKRTQARYRMSFKAALEEINSDKQLELEMAQDVLDLPDHKLTFNRQSWWEYVADRRFAHDSRDFNSFLWGGSGSHCPPGTSKLCIHNQDDLITYCRMEAYKLLENADLAPEN